MILAEDSDPNEKKFLTRKSFCSRTLIDDEAGFEVDGKRVDIAT